MTGMTNVNNSGGGGFKMDELIAQFRVAAGMNVDAQRFVQFVDEFAVISDTQLSTEAQTAFFLKAIPLPDGNVFIAHRYGNSLLYGMVVSINGTTITPGEDVKLSDIARVNEKSDAIILSNGKIFITYNVNSLLYGIVVSINGTTITPGTDTQLSTGQNTGLSTNVISLSSDKLFIAYLYGSNYNPHGMIVTIDDTTITPGTDVTINSYKGSAYHDICAILLPTGKVFVTYGYSVAIHGIVLTINGTTFTPWLICRKRP